MHVVDKGGAPAVLRYLGRYLGTYVLRSSSVALIHSNCNCNSGEAQAAIAA